MSRGRRIVVIGLAVVALLLAALAATALLIPGERVAAAVAARAEAMLGQRVRIDDVGLRFLPLPGVRLSGVRVGGTDGTGSEGTDSAGTGDALAAADAIELRAHLLPLLRGRVVIGSLTLERPHILLEIDSAGRSNLPVLRGEAAGDPGAAAGGRDIAFAIERLVVSEGRLTYRDRRDGSTVRLDGWDQQLRIAGDVRQGRLGHVELAGWLEADDVDAALPKVVLPLRDVTLRVTHDALLDRAADRLELRTLALAADGITLTGSGSIDSLSSATGRRASLALRADGFDAGTLIELVPDSMRARLALPGGRRLDPEGTAALTLDVDGPLTAGAMPDFDGGLTLTDGQLAAGDVAVVDRARADVVFSADSVVARAAGALLGEAFSVAVAVREPAAPSAVVAFNGRADLARLAALDLVSDTLGLGGQIHAEVRGLLPLRDPAGARAAGTVQLAGVRAAGVGPGLAVTAGTVTLSGQRLRVDPLTIRLGGGGAAATDVVIRAEVDGWIPALLDSAAAPPQIAAELTADTLDLDRLLGAPEGEYPALLFARLRDEPLEDGRTAAEAAEQVGLRLPDLPAVDAEARVRVDRIVRSSLAYDDVDATIRVRPQGAELLAGTFRFMGGTIRATGALTPTSRDTTGAPDQAHLTATYALTEVTAGSFFDRLTPFRDRLTGQLALAGAVAMDLDHQMLPERATLGADGSVAVSDGRVANWRLLEAAGQRLGLEALDTIRFRDWAGAFRVTGPLVTLQETALDGREIGARAAGSFDFGGRLDLGATVYLSRELAARAGAIGEQILAAAGTADRIPIGLRIVGTTESPDIRLDLSEARETVVARARAAAEEEAREVVARAGGALLDRFEVPDSLRGLPPDSLRAVIGDSLFQLLPDSLRLPSDSLRTRAEDALKQRLRRLFGGG